MIGGDPRLLSYLVNASIAPKSWVVGKPYLTGLQKACTSYVWLRAEGARRSSPKV